MPSQVGTYDPVSGPDGRIRFLEDDAEVAAITTGADGS